MLGTKDAIEQQEIDHSDITTQTELFTPVIPEANQSVVNTAEFVANKMMIKKLLEIRTHNYRSSSS